VSQHARRFERGFVLVSSLLLLVVVTILAVGLFRSFGMDEKIAGNTRDKQRALQAAMSAQDYAEWWLANGNGTSTITCTGQVTVPAGQVCINTLQSIVPNVAIVAASNLVSGWAGSNGTGTPIGVTYLPPNMAVNQQNLATGTYYKKPAFYISYMGIGTSPNGGTGIVYQIDAVGYGGSPSTTAVVESTYIVVPNIANNKGGP
jgi:type IV pilus assembly protein PilX